MTVRGAVSEPPVITTLALRMPTPSDVTTRPTILPPRLADTQMLPGKVNCRRIALIEREPGMGVVLWVCVILEHERRRLSDGADDGKPEVYQCAASRERVRLECRDDKMAGISRVWGDEHVLLSVPVVS